MQRKPPGVFITGSDTGVGKTFVGALIARSLRDRGLNVGVYKPVASGCRPSNGGLICDDAEALWRAAGCAGELDRVCPQRFAAPLAPHLAAAAEGQVVDRTLLRSGIEYWQSRSDVVVIEGAGGLMSPLTPDEYNVDLAYDLGYPLVVVVANRIGAINQAMQTVIAAAVFKTGFPIAGVVLSQTTDNLATDPSVVSNAQELARRLSDKPVIEVRFGVEAVDWQSLLQHVNR